jgi:hypothetical protein
MLGILTNDTDNTVPFNHLALVTNRFHTGTDFHPISPLPRTNPGELKFIANFIRFVNLPIIKGSGPVNGPAALIPRGDAS